jgi:hypothetical protein
VQGVILPPPRTTRTATAPFRPVPPALFPPLPPCQLKSARSAAHLPRWQGGGQENRTRAYR